MKPSSCRDDTTLLKCHTARRVCSVTSSNSLGKVFCSEIPPAGLKKTVTTIISIGWMRICYMHPKLVEDIVIYGLRAMVVTHWDIPWHTK